MKHPNLVFVFPDQMRGQALGFLGEDPVVTPHLDRFAQESLVLPEAVANYPVCSPYRAMFMTGMYSHANHVISNCTNKTEPIGCELQASDRCWSDVLKDQGYSLGYIGKWHLDSPREPYADCANNHGELKWNEWCPPERRHGFDYWYAYGTYDFHMRPLYWSNDVGRDEFHYVDQWGPEHEADLAVEYIANVDGTRRDPEQPFALVVSMNPPHTPYDQFPQEYLRAYEGVAPEELLVRPNVDRSGASKMSKHALAATKNYFANITGVDAQFGRILRAIEDAGLKDDTIVVFTSDHGNCVGTHDEGTKNNLFEESMRVPFLIRWPSQIEARHDDLLLSSPDLYPTLIDLLGFADQIPAGVEGTSHAAVFLGEPSPRPSSQLYLKIPYTRPEHGLRGVRTHAYKLVIEAEANQPLAYTLFDRRSDPYELTNIAVANPTTIAELVRDELRPWLEKTGDPWLKNLPID